MSKYKIGDKVTIRKDLQEFAKTPEGKCEPGIVSDMIENAGKVATICEVWTIQSQERYSLKEYGYSWVANYFEAPVAPKTITFTVTVTATTPEDAKTQFDKLIKKAFNPPRQWTDAEEQNAKAFVLEQCATFAEENSHCEQIIFSNSSDHYDNSGKCKTFARILFVSGLWPKDACTTGNNEAIFSYKQHLGIACLREGENNKPWIGKMFALCKLLDLTPPTWATK